MTKSTISRCLGFLPFGPLGCRTAIKGRDDDEAAASNASRGDRTGAMGGKGGGDGENKRVEDGPMLKGEVSSSLLQVATPLEDDALVVEAIGKEFLGSSTATVPTVGIEQEVVEEAGNCGEMVAVISSPMRRRISDRMNSRNSLSSRYLTKKGANAGFCLVFHTM